MRNGIIIQIKGLGVPVQAASNRNTDGYEVRWSSDPEVSTDSPTHVLIGQKELQLFVELAVDSRFVVADLMNLIHVQVPEGVNAVSRHQAIAAGVNPDNWDTVRVALVIAGNSSRGPVMDEIEWIGSREEYAEGSHLQEAFAHANRRGISGTSIFTHTDSDCGHILRAAEFFNRFRRQLKPSLRAAEVMVRTLETNLCDLDLTNINPDRAAHYLREIQNTFIQSRNQKLMELEDTGQIDAGNMRKAQDNIDALVSEAADSPAPRPSGPRLH